MTVIPGGEYTPGGFGIVGMPAVRVFGDRAAARGAYLFLVAYEDIELRVVVVVSLDEFTDDVGGRYPRDGDAVVPSECVKLA
ncbi:hypothetical protein ABZT16_08750 [Streptomyces flaveolus]|uniref:hypothetical protein n=1 Tax=Streptomyces flaveolus TaxID=67297 RepID=UPI0033A0659F